MLVTLLRRITISTLDAAIERGRAVSVPPVRWMAAAIDRARPWMGLDVVQREAPLPDWTGAHPHRPMWDSDRKKLLKWQIDKGIVQPEPDQDVGPATVMPSVQSDAPIKVFYQRGCPYARAAIDLLREREIAFEAQDIKGDEVMRSWLKNVTGRRTTPQIFIRGELVGGFDELRTLDQSGELLQRVGVTTKVEAAVVVEDEVSVAELRDRLEDGASVLLLDVRSAEEIASGVIEGAVHIPLDQLGTRHGELDANGVWIAYCHSGVRSRTASGVLREHGFRSVVSLAGGIAAWRQAGGQVVSIQAPSKPKKVSLSVIHPERSPFEQWAGADGDAAMERLEGDALVARVRDVLDECRPLVQADGGDIELLDVIGDVVHIQLTGNCIGCPSSQATLRQGIERRLRARIPQLVGIASPQLAPG